MGKYKRSFIELYKFFLLNGKVENSVQNELFNSIDTEAAFNKVKSRIKQRESDIKTRKTSLAISVCAAAAVVIAFVFLKLPENQYKQEVSINYQTKLDTTSVYIILSEGTYIKIPDNETVIIDNQYFSGTSTNGTLYCSNNPFAEDNRFNINTIITPIGKNYRIILEDGSLICMNAATTLSFPTLFNLREREVYLQGEAFFDINNTGDYPFVVKTDNLNVKVMGTLFNVRAYEDEAYAFATLIKGAVQVNNNKSDNYTNLRPSEQYSLNLSTMKQEIAEVDTNIVTAWMNDMFVFKNEKLGAVMSDLRKWYVFNYEFEDKMASEVRISGNIKRDKKLDEVFYMISELNKVQINKNNGTFYIMKK